MKIGISTRGLSQGSYAISTIVLQLTRKIIELADSQHEIFLYHNDLRHAELFASTAIQRGYKLNNRFIWDQVWLPYLLKKDNIDIALFMKGTMPELIPCRGAVIFHDLGYFDDQMRPYLSFNTTYMKTMMSRAATKAAMVFTVSEYTQNDTIRIFGLNPNKTRVCYEDCSPDYKPITDQSTRNAIRTRYDLPEKIIFCPISISPRKNIPRILTAFEKIKDKIPHTLVITGGQSSKEKALVQRFNSGFYQTTLPIAKPMKTYGMALYSSSAVFTPATLVTPFRAKTRLCRVPRGRRSGCSTARPAKESTSPTSVIGRSIPQTV
jgi:glycosyltransferase involved in cell wall biosynthesis